MARQIVITVSRTEDEGHEWEYDVVMPDGYRFLTNEYVALSGPNGTSVWLKGIVPVDPVDEQAVIYIDEGASVNMVDVKVGTALFLSGQAEIFAHASTLGCNTRIEARTEVRIYDSVTGFRTRIESAFLRDALTINKAKIGAEAVVRRDVGANNVVDAGSEVLLDLPDQPDETLIDTTLIAVLQNV